MTRTAVAAPPADDRERLRQLLWALLQQRLGQRSLKLAVTTIRLDGVLGQELRCHDHGLVAWSRTSMMGDVIAAHVRRHHVVPDGLGSPSDRELDRG